MNIPRLTKNNKIMLIKLAAQIVSTYHMIDVLQSYGPLPIAAIAGFSLGLGEYMISQEYAAMNPRNRLKKLLLWTLVGLSIISGVANIESFVRYYAWETLAGVQFYYVIIAGVVYAVSMPTVIVVTSFIRYDEKEAAAAAPAKKKKRETVSADVLESLVGEAG
jgi:uncharacterized membrane protein